MELRQSTEQVVRVGVFVHEQEYGYPNNPVYGVTLDWFTHKYLIKANGTVVLLSGRTWDDVLYCMGVYNLTLTTHDTNQLGPLDIYMHSFDALGKPMFMRFNVINPNSYDSKYGNTVAAVDSRHAQKG